MLLYGNTIRERPQTVLFSDPKTERIFCACVFQTPMDCDYMPNDIVPIAVGITLALLIVLILIFYIIGRRRQRFAGYESV